MSTESGNIPYLSDELIETYGLNLFIQPACNDEKELSRLMTYLIITAWKIATDQTEIEWINAKGYYGSGYTVYEIFNDEGRIILFLKDYSIYPYTTSQEFFDTTTTLLPLYQD